MKILVTGGSGFIGSNFVKHLLRDTDHDATIIDSLTYSGTKKNLDGALDDSRLRFVEGDIRNEDLVNELASETDAIVNFAAESHVDRSIEGAKPFVSTNIQGAQALLDAAVEHDHNRFLQISTDEVYGQVLEGNFIEEDPLNPRNPYAATKASADMLARSYHITHDLPVLITRSSNNYGPNQHREKLIPKFITRAAKGEPLPLYGDGQQIREWTFVEDNCRAIRRVLEDGSPGEIYNIGSGHELSNLEVTNKILQELDQSTDLIEFIDDRPGHDRRYSLSSEKIRSLGWEPQTTFEQGIKQTIEHYTSQES